MKVVILAGGLGSRLTEETDVRPKPMVEIGGRPILWHILKHYAHYGFKEFVIALGYKGEVIKRFFLDYQYVNNSISVDLARGTVTVHPQDSEDWLVHLIDTGLHTNTGGRIKRLEPWLRDGTFMATYGDGVSNVDLRALLAFHKAQGRAATVTAVRPPSRFGGLTLDGDQIVQFTEKPQIGEGWINGGFLVFEPKVFDYLLGDDASLENDALDQLASEGQLSAFRHEQFWQCMDTLREKRLLEQLWQSGAAPWKVWS
jgi:glucose-1-phosphate cytidylyltransferase